MRLCKYCGKGSTPEANICVKCVPVAIETLRWHLARCVGGIWDEIPTGGGCSALSAPFWLGKEWGRVMVASDALAPVPDYDTYATCWVEDSRGFRIAEKDVDFMGNPLTNGHISMGVSDVIMSAANSNRIGR